MVFYIHHTHDARMDTMYRMMSRSPTGLAYLPSIHSTTQPLSMPYALFAPRSPPSSWYPDRPSTAPKPHYTTDDRAVAQVFHSYGWVVLRIPHPHPSSPNSTSEDDFAVWWNSDSDEDAPEYEDMNSYDGGSDARIENSSAITRYSNLTELLHPGVVLDEEVWDGPQVEERVKWTVMWMADWTMDREVDLRYAL